MAQANAVQREPSMEEILASIRRIIEDSDTDRVKANDDKPEAGGVARRVMAAESRNPLPENDDLDKQADAFRGELRGSLADSPTQAATVEPSGRSDGNVAPLRSVPQEAASDAAPVRVQEQPARREPSLPYLSDRPDSSLAPERSPATRPSSPTLASVSPAQRPTIISEQAGRQVAAAFGELSDAFAASRRKSFDEVAEEMMRPMLREWMDNNLPHLVERLVREEIDRIARGAPS